MITKKGTARCDYCGRFISWDAIESGSAQGTYTERFELTLGGYEGPIEGYDAECATCLARHALNWKRKCWNG